MKRPITWAELILAILLLAGGVVSCQKLYGFLTDRISIEIHVKK